eukprot:scaffold120865_cov18-Tisochrysis_lutea.AAC.2
MSAGLTEEVELAACFSVEHTTSSCSQELEVAWPDTEAKEGRKGIANGAHSRVWSDLTHRLSGEQ